MSLGCWGRAGARLIVTRGRPPEQLEGAWACLPSPSTPTCVEGSWKGRKGPSNITMPFDRASDGMGSRVRSGTLSGTGTQLGVAVSHQLAEIFQAGQQPVKSTSGEPTSPLAKGKDTHEPLFGAAVCSGALAFMAPPTLGRGLSISLSDPPGEKGQLT